MIAINSHRENPLISIIIPVYNSEKYIRACLESVLNQDYKNLEIIIINDGSTDRSGNICEDYAQKDRRIQVIHESNEGVSTARNSALSIVKGEFVSFVDADDFVEVDFISELYRAMTEYRADVAICGYEKVEEVKGKYRTGQYVLNISGIISIEDTWFHSIDSNKIGCYLCNKLFKKELLKSIRLKPELTIGEDLVFWVEYLKQCNRVAYVCNANYKYRMNQQSAMNRSVIEKCGEERTKQLIKEKINSILSATQQVIMEVQSKEMIFQQMAAYRKVRSCLWCMFKMVNAGVYDKESFTKIKQGVRENYLSYRKVPCGSMIQKGAAIVLYISPKTVYFMGRVCKVIFPEFINRISKM